MHLRRTAAAVLGLALAIWGMPRPVAAAKSYAASRFDVTARALPDRSLRVEERIVFRFEGDYTYVFRAMPQDRTDGVRDVEAEMDGTRFPVGEGPGTIELKEGRDVRITWHFAPATGTHAFTLRYRLAGLVTADGGQDVLEWQALPRRHEYAIEQASIAVQWPAGVRPIGSPMVSPSTAVVRTGADAIEITQAPVRRDESIRLDLRMLPGAFARDAPLWQRAIADRARRGPLLLLVAATVLVLGLGWLAAFWSAWRRSDMTPPMAAPLSGPPDPSLPVAFTPALVGGNRHGPAAAVTMIDLASRGVIAIEQAPRARLRGRAFRVSLLHEPSQLRLHETAWLDVAFGAGRSEREVSLETVQRRFARVRNPFAGAIQSEMRHSGLVDPERVTARRTLVRAALVAALLALAGVGVAWLLAPGFGVWAAVIPASFALVALACASAAITFSSLTREGERIAVQWRGFFAYLRRSAKDRATGPAPTAADWLSYAVAAGVGEAWVRRLAAIPGGYTPPAWFHAAAAGDDHNAAFVAFVGTHATTADAGGGGGGGGAAGGGASGAG